jgi:hypothetical protein
VQYTFKKVYFGNGSFPDDPGLVSAVMFAVIDEMGADLLESVRRVALVAVILEGIILMELGQLKSSGI